jgi:phosphatidylglycerophosphate synthase
MFLYISSGLKKSVGVLIYIASCLTDFLDGYLARKLKLTSPFGAFLDPVADKVSHHIVTPLSAYSSLDRRYIILIIFLNLT